MVLFGMMPHFSDAMRVGLHITTVEEGSNGGF
jgi:hypothetical protein